VHEFPCVFAGFLAATHLIKVKQYSRLLPFFRRLINN